MDRVRFGRIAKGPDPRWLDPTVEGYQGPCVRGREPVCRCARCEPRPAQHFNTLECGCIMDGSEIVFMHPTCLSRAAQGRSRGLASAGSRADQTVLLQRVMALHELDAGRGGGSPRTGGFSRSKFGR